MSPKSKGWQNGASVRAVIGVRVVSHIRRTVRMKFAIVAASLVTFGLFQTVSAGGQAATRLGATEVPASRDAP
jgi:hypothetical protein